MNADEAMEDLWRQKDLPELSADETKFLHKLQLAEANKLRAKRFRNGGKRSTGSGAALIRLLMTAWKQPLSPRLYIKLRDERQ